MWRRRQEPRPTSPIPYPDGLMVDTGEVTYYIKGGRKYPVFSKRVLDSWAITPILSSEVAVSRIPKGTGYLGFRDGTLIHNFADGKLYLISGNKRRQITSPDVFQRYGIKRDSAIVVSEDEVALHAEGEPIK